MEGAGCHGRTLRRPRVPATEWRCPARSKSIGCSENEYWQAKPASGTGRAQKLEYVIKLTSPYVPRLGESNANGSGQAH
jgi:hypothetical protein